MYYSRPCKHISSPLIAENYHILNICVTKCQYIRTNFQVYGDYVCMYNWCTAFSVPFRTLCDSKCTIFWHVGKFLRTETSDMHWCTECIENKKALQVNMYDRNNNNSSTWNLMKRQYFLYSGTNLYINSHDISVNAHTVLLNTTQKSIKLYLRVNVFWELHSRYCKY